MLLGNGDGTFQPPKTFAPGSIGTYLVAGDFNGDGKLDLAIADPDSNSVSVFLGNGDGTFQAAVAVPRRESGLVLWWRVISTVMGDSTWPWQDLYGYPHMVAARHRERAAGRR